MKMSTVLQTPTTHRPNDSIEFYSKLGFTKIDSGFLQDEEQVLFTDGSVLVSVNPKRTARTAIRLFGDWAEIKNSLTQYSAVAEENGRILVSDPSGVLVYLEPGLSVELSGEPCSLLGKFAGLSLETTDMNRSVEFWKCLGFAVTCGAPEQGWLTMEQDGFTGISIMKFGSCPHLFYSPGMTYFNSGKNLENIAKIKEAGIDILEEITAFNPDGLADNVILRDPGGTSVFLFND